jgi:hypothetical protein
VLLLDRWTSIGETRQPRVITFGRCWRAFRAGVARCPRSRAHPSGEPTRERTPSEILLAE